MKLKKTLNIKPSTKKIAYKDTLFFIGSCFSENISAILKKRKFNLITNPFGIVYNPISVFSNINLALKNKAFNEKDAFFHNELWKSFSFHSDMSFQEKEVFLENINSTIKNTNKFLKNSTFIFITFGTAWVYEYNNNIVANCHKVAKDKFIKRLLSISEIVEKASETLQKLFENNQNAKIIFTISPVRHLKDGFVENNQSKAVLHLAIKEILEKFSNTAYFPSYEFVIDDLRDYRFYKEDFVHPNSLAIKYIIEKFDDYFFDLETKLTIKKIEKIQTSLQHKPFNANTKAHKDFLQKLNLQIEEIKKMGIAF